MTRAPGTVTIPADSHERVDLSGLGIVWKIDGADADGRFSVVHHPLAPACPCRPPPPAHP